MKPNGGQSLERILESAIVVSRPNLMPGAQTGLIHLEYGFAAGRTLDYLKVSPRQSVKLLTASLQYPPSLRWLEF